MDYLDENIRSMKWNRKRREDIENFENKYWGLEKVGNDWWEYKFITAWWTIYIIKLSV